MNRILSLAAAAAVAFTLPAFAEGITITDAYARSASPSAMTGAAFMTITNDGPEDDRLIAARSEAAERVELHTHLIDANGVARMVEVEDGFVIPAGGSHVLERGGDHVMFLGLTAPFEPGGTVPLTLVFEKAGEIAVELPVDMSRGPAQGMGHGVMHGHGN
jgi:copper(I)-binding protein